MGYVASGASKPPYYRLAICWVKYGLGRTGRGSWCWEGPKVAAVAAAATAGAKYDWPVISAISVAVCVLCASVRVMFEPPFVVSLCALFAKTAEEGTTYNYN